MTSAFEAEFVRLRQAYSCDPPDWGEVRAVEMTLSVHAKPGREAAAIRALRSAVDRDA